MPAIKQDHRPRVAAEKRERMRSRLIESALQVFAQKGPDVPVIDDVIELAEVSRGTFYNYFNTNEELMRAVFQTVSDEIIVLVDAAISEMTDPALRLAAGIRILLHTTRKHLLLARFVARMDIDQSMGKSLAVQYLTRDVSQGIQLACFELPSVQVGVTLVLGTVQAAISAMTHPQALSSAFPEEIAFHTLLALGVQKGVARSLVDSPIQAVQFIDGSLLERTCTIE